MPFVFVQRVPIAKGKEKKRNNAPFLSINNKENVNTRRMCFQKEIKRCGVDKVLNEFRRSEAIADGPTRFRGVRGI
jgi:hypothetical protein